MSENDKQNASVYLPETNITAATSQSVYHYNFLQAYLEDQQSKNEELTQKLEKLFLQGNVNNKAQGEKIQHLAELLFAQEALSKTILDEAKHSQDDMKAILHSAQQTERIAKETEKKLMEEELVHTAILDQFVIQENAINTLSKTLVDVKHSSESLSVKMNDAEETQQKIAEKLDLQEVFQKTMLEKMENTDANISKISRQMEHLKGIVFERVQFLANKLEDNMKSFTTPVHAFFVKADEKENK